MARVRMGIDMLRECLAYVALFCDSNVLGMRLVRYHWASGQQPLQGVAQPIWSTIVPRMSLQHTMEAFHVGRLSILAGHMGMSTMRNRVSLP